jgi:hypothetical protein
MITCCSSLMVRPPEVSWATAISRPVVRDRICDGFSSLRRFGQRLGNRLGDFGARKPNNRPATRIGSPKRNGAAKQCSTCTPPMPMLEIVKPRINPRQQIANAQGFGVMGNKTSPHLSHYTTLARLGRNNGHLLSNRGRARHDLTPSQTADE